MNSDEFEVLKKERKDIWCPTHEQIIFLNECNRYVNIVSLQVWKKSPVSALFDS